MLTELMQAYAGGETDVQHHVLDEVEPLLFGMIRSLLPGGGADAARAAELTHALVLAFHLRAVRGELASLRSANDLRAYAHRAARAKLADPAPLATGPLADPETGSMVFRCLGLELTLADELTDAERAALVVRLEGRRPEGDEAAAWKTAKEKLRGLGLLR